MSGIEAVRLDGPAFAALEPEWWELWRRAPGASPFTAPAWLLPWWDRFRPGELRAVALRQGGRLVGLAPVWAERGENGARLLPMGLGNSDLFDLLLDPETGPAGEAAMAAALADGLHGLDTLDLEEVPAGALALRLPAPPGWDDVCAIQTVRPVFTLADGMPARKRRKLAMARNRTARRDGAVEQIDLATMDEGLADLFRLHAARWAERGLPGVLADPVVQGFHREAWTRLEAAGLARIYRLNVEGTVAGIFFGLRSGDTVSAYIGGLHPDFHFESPGTVLIGHAIDHGARTGAAFLDFLRGGEPYKYEWGAVDRHNHRRTWRRR